MAKRRRTGILKLGASWFRRMAKRRWPEWCLQREIDELSREFDTEIASATNPEDRRNLVDELYSRRSPLDDQLEQVRSRKLVRRADRVLVGLDEIPLPQGETAHWTEGSWNTSFLTPKSFRALLRRVEDAEYERAKRKREEREAKVKLYTAVAATIAAIAGLLNLVLRIKVSGSP